MSRQKANFKILWKLIIYFIKNPDIRFFQGLRNVGIIENKKTMWNGYEQSDMIIKDKHYEESDITLKNIMIIKE